MLPPIVQKRCSSEAKILKGIKINNNKRFIYYTIKEKIASKIIKKFAKLNISII